jgi:alpha-D-glucose phosphate-specific phosphoglucomutase
VNDLPIKFGTDGWRAIIAEDFTFANVRACAAAAVRYLRSRGLDERPFVVGYDTRFASEDFAAAVAEVAAAAGIRTLLADRPCPTPVVSFAILERGAGGAVVITASHNPWRYNGFKYKPEYAGSASPEIVAAIEAELPAILAGPAPGRLPLPDAEARGLVERFDPRAGYLARLGELVDIAALRSAGLRVAIDAMYGAGAGYFPELLTGGATTVVELHGQRNPIFPGIASPEPIAKNLEELCAFVPREGFDVGIANDGDADRVGLVDERGRFINQLQVFALLTYYLLEYRGERGPIVKSVTTTQMVQRLGEQYGVPVYETPVGFKYLGPKMLEVGALIGGEESGGYGFRGHIPERDGVLAGLYLLDFIARTGKRPSELLDELSARVGPHFYDRVDIHLSEEERPKVLARAQAARPDAIAGLRVTGIDTTDGFRFVLDGRGWLLLRFSGTEPLLRIYTEVDDEALVQRVLDAGRELVGA